ncbi:MAG: fatty acid desaturase [Chitinophagaceae bacterium]
MRDKHLYIAQDSELLKLIYRQVDEQLVVDRKASGRLIAMKFIVYFLLSVITYSLLYVVRDPGWFITCFMAYGFVLLLFAFNFSHDFSHNTVFSSKQWNNVCFTIIYAMVGAHAEAWKQRHVNSHHYAPNVEAYDSDLKITKLIRVIPESEYKWYHRYQHIYAPVAYTSYSLFWVFIKDVVILYSKDEYNKKKGGIYHLSFWLQKLFYLALVLILPLLFSLQPWYIVVTGFVCMHLFQSLFLLFTFFMTHHVESTAYPVTDDDGFINTSWLMNQVKSSNDMHPFSHTANFILGGFNNHIAHHLFPHIHHIHYPRLSRILYRILEQHNIIPNQTTYWGGIASHWRLLKQMGRPV